MVLATCQVFQHLRAAILRDNMWVKNTLVSLEFAERKIREKLALEEDAPTDDPKYLEKVLVLEQSVDNVLNAEHSGLCHLLHEERNGVEKLVQVLLEAGKDLARSIAQNDGTGPISRESDANCPPWQSGDTSDRCRLTQLGPELQRMVFLPENVALSSVVAPEESSRLGTKLPKIIWLEAGSRIPLREAARLLIENRPDYVPVADRLLTRADITWIEL